MARASRIKRASQHRSYMTTSIMAEPHSVTPHHGSLPDTRCQRMRLHLRHGRRRDPSTYYTSEGCSVQHTARRTSLLFLWSPGTGTGAAAAPVGAGSGGPGISDQLKTHPLRACPLAAVETPHIPPGTGWIHPGPAQEGLAQGVCAEPRAPKPRQYKKEHNTQCMYGACGMFGACMHTQVLGRRCVGRNLAGP